MTNLEKNDVARVLKDNIEMFFDKLTDGFNEILESEEIGDQLLLLEKSTMDINICKSLVKYFRVQLEEESRQNRLFIDDEIRETFNSIVEITNIFVETQNTHVTRLKSTTIQPLCLIEETLSMMTEDTQTKNSEIQQQQPIVSEIGESSNMVIAENEKLSIQIQEENVVKDATADIEPLQVSALSNESNTNVYVNFLSRCWEMVTNKKMLLLSVVLFALLIVTVVMFILGKKKKSHGFHGEHSYYYQRRARIAKSD